MAKILVVDDEPGICELLEDQLQRAGHTVTMARDGKEALRAITTGDGFQLVITDIFMPERDGLELIVDCRKRGLKVIGMTGNDPAMLKPAMMMGAVEVLRKPFSLDELTIAIETALRA